MGNSLVSIRPCCNPHFCGVSTPAESWVARVLSIPEDVHVSLWADVARRARSRLHPRWSEGGAEAGAERGLAVVVVLVRSGTICQICIGAIYGATAASPASLYLAVTAAVVANSAAMCVSAWRRKEVRSRPWGWIDLALAPVAMVICALALPSGFLIGSWEGWASGNAGVAIAVAGIWLRSVERAAFAALLMAGAYFVVAVASGTPDLGSVIGNTLTFPVFGVTAAVFSAYWRSLAKESDQMHVRAVEMAQQIELDRYKILVHDATGILRLLGDETVPQPLLPALRRQAKLESSRMRAYLTHEPRVGTPELNTLAGVVDRALEGFSDLPLEVATDLAARVQMTEPDALAVQRAVTTLLHNVRIHASADQVIVHADELDGHWEVIVADDGTGFMPVPTAHGFGLREQVFRALSERGITVDLDSVPGQGTTVTMTGALLSVSESDPR